MDGELCMLLIESHTWRVGTVHDDGCVFVDVPIDDQQDWSARAAAAAEVLREHGYSGRGLVLGIPSTWCLWASVDTENLPRKHWRRRLVDRFEENLPLAAEALVVDIIGGARTSRTTRPPQTTPGKKPGTPRHAMPTAVTSGASGSSGGGGSGASGGTSGGVAVELELLGRLVGALEAQQVSVQCICPTALLALQGLLATRREQETSIVVWADGAAADVFTLVRGMPTNWTHLPSGSHGLRWAVAPHLLYRPANTPVLVVNVGEEQQGCADAGFDRSQIVPGENTPADVACRAASGVLGGALQPWVDLRRDQLAATDPLRHVRGALNAAVVAAVLLGLVVSGAFLWRAQGYATLVDRYEQQQQAIFRSMYPGQVVPQNVPSRLASEARRWQSVSGHAENVPDFTSAFHTLYESRRRLPGDDLRYRLVEIRIDRDQLYLDGQTRTHADADTIAAALRARQGFEVEAPRTERFADRGVSFKLNATVLPQALRDAATSSAEGRERPEQASDAVDGEMRPGDVTGPSEPPPGSAGKSAGRLP